MTWTLLNNATQFSGGVNSYTYTIPSGAPSKGQLDVIVATATDTLNTPSGWTAGPSQAALSSVWFYIWYVIAGSGAPSTVTITSTDAANFSIEFSWMRFDTGAKAADKSASAVRSSASSSTPAATTGLLSATGELSVAGGGTFNGTAVFTGVSWSAGYLPVNDAASSGSSWGVLAGYNANAGTSAESPSVSWTSATWTAQATLVQTFLPIPTRTGNGNVVQPGAADGSFTYSVASVPGKIT